MVSLTRSVVAAELAVMVYMAGREVYHALRNATIHTVYITRVFTLLISTRKVSVHSQEYHGDHSTQYEEDSQL